MTATLNRALFRLTATVAAAVACAIVTADRPDLTPVDRALPFLAVLVSILGWLAIRFDSVVFSALPILVGLSIAIGDERTRLLSYGEVVAVAALIAILGATGGGKLDLARAIGFGLVLVSALRAIPTVPLSVFPLLMGIALLTLALSESGRVGIHILPVVIAIGALTPVTPLRVTLFPSILAALILFASRGSLLILGVATVLGVLGGKWALLMVAIVAMARLAFGGTFVIPRLGFVTPPPWVGSWTVAARVFAFAPAAAWDLIVAPRSAAAASLILAAIAVAMRPALSLLFGLAAISIVLPVIATRTRLITAVPQPCLFLPGWGFWHGAERFPRCFRCPLPVQRKRSKLRSWGALWRPARLTSW